MADPKPGKVLRVDPKLHKYLTNKKGPKESWSSVIRRELGLLPRRGTPEFDVSFVLPSDLHETAAEARGVSVLRSAKLKSKTIEKPLMVRLVE